VVVNVNSVVARRREVEDWAVVIDVGDVDDDAGVAEQRVAKQRRCRC